MCESENSEGESKQDSGAITVDSNAKQTLQQLDNQSKEKIEKLKNDNARFAAEQETERAKINANQSSKNLLETQTANQNIAETQAKSADHRSDNELQSDRENADARRHETDKKYGPMNALLAPVLTALVPAGATITAAATNAKSQEKIAKEAREDAATKAEQAAEIADAKAALDALVREKKDYTNEKMLIDQALNQKGPDASGDNVFIQKLSKEETTQYDTYKQLDKTVLEQKSTAFNNAIAANQTDITAATKTYNGLIRSGGIGSSPHLSSVESNISKRMNDLGLTKATPKADENATDDVGLGKTDDTSEDNLLANYLCGETGTGCRRKYLTPIQEAFEALKAYDLAAKNFKEKSDDPKVVAAFIAAGQELCGTTFNLDNKKCGEKKDDGSNPYEGGALHNLYAIQFNHSDPDIKLALQNKLAHTIQTFETAKTKAGNGEYQQENFVEFYKAHGVLAPIPLEKAAISVVIDAGKQLASLGSQGSSHPKSPGSGAIEAPKSPPLKQSEEHADKLDL